MTRVTLYCSLLFLLFQSSVFGQEPNYHWMKKMEIIRAEDFYFEPNNHLLVDSRGNVYRLQAFGEKAILEDTIITTDADDAFLLTKHNRQGKLEWARKIVGYEDGDYSYWGWTNSFCFDPQENLVISGYFWSDELDFGNGKRLALSCNSSFCDNLFTATYSPQGKLLDAVAFELPEDYQALYPILHVDSRGKKIFSFLTDAPELNIGGKQVKLSKNINLATLQLSPTNELELFSSIKISGRSFFLPFNSSTQKDGSILIFGNVNGPDEKILTLTDQDGASYSIKELPGYYDMDMLLKQSSSGKLLWALDIAGAGCQMLADSSGNTYLFGFFSDSLHVRGELLFKSKSLEGEGDGFILKIGTDGKILWQKHLPSAPIPVYGGTLFSSFPGGISPDGDLLVPLYIVHEDAETPREIDGKEIQTSYENYSSAIAHFSSEGQLEHLIPIETSNGIMFASSCRFDPDGRIHAIFRPVEMDSLKVGAYRYAVEQEYTEFLACFSLDKQLPGVNFPVLRTKYDRDIRIRISPNPTSDKAELRWEPQETPASLILRDAVGRQLQVLKVEPLVMEASFDLSKYAPGVYYIEWQDKHTFHSAKVVKY